MLADSIPSNQKFSCKWNSSFFKAVLSNRLSFYLGSPFHMISSLFSHFYLFQNAILHKKLKLRFCNFKPVFLRMQFSLVATIFSLLLVISLSWYLHLTISYLTLWKPNGLSIHLKGHQVIGLDLSTSAKLAVKWIILKWYYVVDLILDSIWIILFQSELHCTFSIFFYPEINKPSIHNTITDISSSQNGLNDLFSSTGFHLKSNVI